VSFVAAKCGVLPQQTTHNRRRGHLAAEFERREVDQLAEGDVVGIIDELAAATIFTSVSVRSAPPSP
jgi:hypothetical protein